MNYISENPIFIVGNQRSGTTLLKNIIQKHSDLFFVDYETHFFEILPKVQNLYPKIIKNGVINKNLLLLTYNIIIHGWKVSQSLNGSNFNLLTKNLPEELNKYINEKIADYKKINHIGLFRFVFEWLTISNNQKRWIEKTPDHIFYIPMIINNFPDSKIIVIIRDPRDFIASRKKRAKNIHKPFFILKEIWDWKKHASIGDKAKNRYKTAVYNTYFEKLIDDTEKEVRRLCDFLNLSFEDPMLGDVPWTGRLESHKERITVEKEKGVSKQTKGRYINILNKYEIELIQLILKRKMKHHTYQFQNQSFNIKMKAIMLGFYDTIKIFLFLLQKPQKITFLKK